MQKDKWGVLASYYYFPQIWRSEGQKPGSILADGVAQGPFRSKSYILSTEATVNSGQML